MRLRLIHITQMDGWGSSLLFWTQVATEIMLGSKRPTISPRLQISLGALMWYLAEHSRSEVYLERDRLLTLG